MNIAFLQRDLPPEGVGGVAYQVHLLARTLASQHRVCVFTTSPIRDDAYEVSRCPLRLAGPAKQVFGMGLAFRALDLSEFDVVHAHGDSWGVDHPQCVRTFYGTAALEAVHATSWKRRVAQATQYGLEAISCYRACIRTAISAHTTKYLPKIDYVIPCGVDRSIFYSQGDRFEQPTLLFVAGLLGGRKRGWLALNSFAALREHIPNVRMIVVSRETVNQPGVECRSNVTPEEMGELFRRSWALCSTSTYEGFGVPYVEAVVSGLPVVATRNPGAIEILQSGGGTVVDDLELVDVLRPLLLEPAPRDNHLTALMADRYGIERIANLYEDVYAVAARFGQ